MSVEHAPSVTTVFCRSPNSAWIVRSLFSPRRSAWQAPEDPYRIARHGRCHRIRLWSSAGFAIFLLVSVAHASALAPIVPIADAMTLAAATGRFQYGWVRGAASAAFVVGAVDAGQVVEATSLGGIAWMNGTILALAAVAALRLPRNAPDRPVVQRQANVRALFAVPGFLPLMALAALVLSSHTLHESFEVLRWEEGGIGPGTAGSATNSCQSDNRMSVSPGIQPCTELQTRAGTWRYDANKTGQVSRPLNASQPVFAMASGCRFWLAGMLYDENQNRLVLAPEYGGDGGKTAGVCDSKQPPFAAFPGHWAPNDLLIYDGSQFPEPYRGGAFVAFHSPGTARRCRKAAMT
jgi:hypothetical protein